MKKKSHKTSHKTKHHKQHSTKSQKKNKQTKHSHKSQKKEGFFSFRHLNHEAKKLRERYDGIHDKSYYVMLFIGFVSLTALILSFVTLGLKLNG